MNKINLAVSYIFYTFAAKLNHFFMSNIVGRKKEIELLQRIVESSEPEFVAIYGRRRVGKTFLIKEFFNNRFTFYFSGSENASMKTQLQNFQIAFQNIF